MPPGARVQGKLVRVDKAGNVIPEGVTPDPLSHDLSNPEGLIKAFGVSKTIAKSLRPGQMIHIDQALCLVLSDSLSLFRRANSGRCSGWNVTGPSQGIRGKYSQALDPYSS